MLGRVSNGRLLRCARHVKGQIRHCHQRHLPLTTLSDQEKIIKDSVATFAKEELQPLVREMDATALMPDSLLKSLFQHGYLGIEISEEFGGVGSTFFASNIVIEEIAKVDMAVSVLVDVQNTLINMLIARYGTANQKQAYLPRLATDLVGSFCLSEESSGSDAFSLKMTAKRDGDHYMLNGTKMWISNAKQAGLFIIMANVDHERGYRGITSFLVDRDTPGLTVGKSEDKLGIRASSTHPVHLEDVMVDKSSILGAEGDGYKFAISMLNEGRIGIAAQLMGMAQGCLDHTLNYTLEREQFGQRIWDFQAVNHTVAELSTQIEAARLLVYNAARRKESGLSFTKEAAMAKFYAAEIACQTTKKCMELLGGIAVSKNFPVEKYYRDCIVGTIYEGTRNIQLNTIAKLLEESTRGH